MRKLWSLHPPTVSPRSDSIYATALNESFGTVGSLFSYIYSRVFPLFLLVFFLCAFSFLAAILSYLSSASIVLPRKRRFFFGPEVWITITGCGGPFNILDTKPRCTVLVFWKSKQTNQQQQKINKGKQNHATLPNLTIRWRSKVSSKEWWGGFTGWMHFRN